MIGDAVDEAASEAAFNATSAILHDLRPKLRTVVTEAFLGHPAYADGNFPIWWQGQNNDQFIKQARPPFYVRFSHHPSRIFQGVVRGQAHIQCYAQTEPWVEALRDIVMAAYPAGEAISAGVMVQSVDVARAWPVKGWDSSKPWPEKADFMLPVSVWWRNGPERRNPGRVKPAGVHIHRAVRTMRRVERSKLPDTLNLSGAGGSGDLLRQLDRPAE